MTRYDLQSELNNEELVFDQTRLSYLNIAEPMNPTTTANFHALVRLPLQR